MLLAKENEEETLRMAGYRLPGDTEGKESESQPNQPSNGKKVRKAEDKVALPSCTTESVNYIIECMACRKQDRKRVYHGETRRSPYQRGKEHLK